MKQNSLKTSLLLGLFLSLILFGYASALTLDNTITRAWSYLQWFFITQNGDSTSSSLIELTATNWVRIVPQSQNPSETVLLAPDGSIIQNSQITGLVIQTGAVNGTSISLNSLYPSSFSIPMLWAVTGEVSGTCPTGEAMIGSNNSLPTCVPIVEAANAWAPCPLGFVFGWFTSLTTPYCISATTWFSLSSSGLEYWEVAPSTSDIFFWTMPALTGNVGIGINAPLAWLHVYQPGPWNITETLFTGTNIITTKPCPYNSGMLITDIDCKVAYGICGSANGWWFYTAPTSNLCAAGNAAPLVGNGPWNWSCQWVNGGTNSSTCFAMKATDWVCGSANGTTYRTAPSPTQRCNVGTPQITNIYVGGTSYYEQWVCQWYDSGANSTTCTWYPVTAGICAWNSEVANPWNPINGNANLCDGSITTTNSTVIWAYVTSLTTISSSPLTKTWYCNGYNGGPASLECKTSYYNGTNTRLHAECGTATQSSPLSSAPTTNLCGYATSATLVVGSMTSVANPSGIEWYRWTCQASGKNNSYCYAPKQ